MRTKRDNKGKTDQMVHMEWDKGCAYACVPPMGDEWNDEEGGAFWGRGKGQGNKRGFNQLSKGTQIPQIPQI